MQDRVNGIISGSEGLAVRADMSSAQCSVAFESYRSDIPNMTAAQLNMTVPKGRARATANARLVAAATSDGSPSAGWLREP